MTHHMLSGVETVIVPFCTDLYLKSSQLLTEANVGSLRSPTAPAATTSSRTTTCACLACGLMSISLISSPLTPSIWVMRSIWSSVQGINQTDSCTCNNGVNVSSEAVKVIVVEVLAGTSSPNQDLALHADISCDVYDLCLTLCNLVNMPN